MTESASLQQSRLPWRIRLLGIAIVVIGLWFLIAHTISWIVYGQQLGLASRFFQIGGGVLHIGCGIGLLKRRNWARYLFIVLMIRMLPYILQTSIAYAVRLYRGFAVAWFLEIPAFVILIVAWTLTVFGIWTLTRPAVRQHFT